MHSIFFNSLFIAERNSLSFSQHSPLGLKPGMLICWPVMDQAEMRLHKHSCSKVTRSQLGLICSCRPPTRRTHSSPSTCIPSRAQSTATESWVDTRVTFYVFVWGSNLDRTSRKRWKPEAKQKRRRGKPAATNSITLRIIMVTFSEEGKRKLDLVWDTFRGTSQHYEGFCCRLAKSLALHICSKWPSREGRKEGKFAAIKPSQQPKALLCISNELSCKAGGEVKPLMWSQERGVNFMTAVLLCYVSFQFHLRVLSSIIHCH